MGNQPSRLQLPASRHEVLIMACSEVYYQIEALADIQAIELGPETKCSEVKRVLATKHGLTGRELFLFVEDSEEVVADDRSLVDLIHTETITLHISSCRQVQVFVNWNDKTACRTFAPGSTVARVKEWAALKEFGIAPTQAGDHALQIEGGSLQPTLRMHVGALVQGDCSIRFDLVARERVNG